MQKVINRIQHTPGKTFIALTVYEAGLIKGGGIRVARFVEGFILEMVDPVLGVEACEDICDEVDEMVGGVCEWMADHPDDVFYVGTCEGYEFGEPGLVDFNGPRGVLELASRLDCVARGV